MESNFNVPCVVTIKNLELLNFEFSSVWRNTLACDLMDKLPSERMFQSCLNVVFFKERVFQIWIVLNIHPEWTQLNPLHTKSYCLSPKEGCSSFYVQYHYIWVEQCNFSLWTPSKSRGFFFIIFFNFILFFIRGLLFVFFVMTKEGHFLTSHLIFNIWQ